MLRNRIVSTAHQTNLVEEHIPAPAMAAYHEARARGGVGLIIVEACAVHPSGLLTIHTIDGSTERVVPGYARVAEAVHRHGGRVFAQLFHGGREVVSSTYRHAALAPSAVPNERFHIMPRPMDGDEIAEVLRGYGRAAALARQAGLDGVELCASHGYLPAQFWSPQTNRRDDGYGGTFEKRMRFAVEALGAMRDGAAGDIVVGIRLSGDELAPGGMNAADMLAVVDYLATHASLDYINVIGGTSATYRASTYIVPPVPLARTSFAHLAAAIKERVSIPVFTASRVVDPREAEAILRRGDADAVAMTRALITDPEMPSKAAAGCFDAITFCIGCNQGCIGHYHKDLPIGCVQNPAAGKELELAGIAPAAAARRVLVVGGGPGGMQAAFTAAERGHRVTLVERQGELGGQLCLALRAPAQHELARTALDNFGRALARTGVEVCLGVAASADDVLAANADAVVLAVGSTPYVPDVPGLGQAHVLTAPEVLEGAATGARVLIADWAGDWPGLDAADVLADAGKSVQLVSSTLYPGEALHQYVRNVFMERMYRKGVTLTPHHALAEVRPRAVVLRNLFTDELVAVEGIDTVVLALGRVASTELYTALKGKVAALHQVGDCLAARSMEEATYEGMRVGLAL
jgi:2,4-dienoyl-CoA reductase-like NADH-dependent reductase (Old Yellow Enzyme family)/thioredoxin reductase